VKSAATHGCSTNVMETAPSNSLPLAPRTWRPLGSPLISERTSSLHGSFYERSHSSKQAKAERTGSGQPMANKPLPSVRKMSRQNSASANPFSAQNASNYQERVEATPFDLSNPFLAPRDMSSNDSSSPFSNVSLQGAVGAAPNDFNQTEEYNVPGRDCSSPTRSVESDSFSSRSNPRWRSKQLPMPPLVQSLPRVTDTYNQTACPQTFTAHVPPAVPAKAKQSKSPPCEPLKKPSLDVKTSGTSAASISSTRNEPPIQFSQAGPPTAPRGLANDEQQTRAFVSTTGRATRCSRDSALTTSPDQQIKSPLFKPLVNSSSLAGIFTFIQQLNDQIAKSRESDFHAASDQTVAGSESQPTSNQGPCGEWVKWSSRDGGSCVDDEIELFQERTIAASGVPCHFRVPTSEESEDRVRVMAYHSRHPTDEGYGSVMGTNDDMKDRSISVCYAEPSPHCLAESESAEWFSPLREDLMTKFQRRHRRPGNEHDDHDLHELGNDDDNDEVLSQKEYEDLCKVRPVNLKWARAPCSDAWMT
jgi:hypothetical protein